jgi:hypothetical protein
MLKSSDGFIMSEGIIPCCSVHLIFAHGRGRAGVAFPRVPRGRAGVSANESLFPMGVLAFP